MLLSQHAAVQIYGPLRELVDAKFLLPAEPRTFSKSLPQTLVAFHSVDRRMAALLQAILIQFNVLLIIATIMTIVLRRDYSGQQFLSNLIANSIALLVFAIALIILRRGYFRASVLIVIAILILLSLFVVVAAMGLNGAYGILLPLTLAMILAGLPLSSAWAIKKSRSG